jgi:choice-of-anchor B domain-containing protein
MGHLRTLLSISILVAVSVSGAGAQGAAPEVGAPGPTAPCIDGLSLDYPCLNIDLVGFVSVASLGGNPLNDLWGWTDPLTGKEYVLLGGLDGTAFFELDEHGQPTYLGVLITRTRSSPWRDIKVYADHAYIVSEAASHGMQVFDLRKLRNPSQQPQFFWSDADYLDFGSAHNLAINEQTAYAYAVGTRTCGRGLHMIDISEPAEPVFAGCFSGDGATHDAHCVVYHGPDAEHEGKEVCFNSNPQALSIVDVTDKAAPVLLSKSSYEGAGYTHQGWLTEDHGYFLLGDEFDERTHGGPTITYFWDVTDLDAPVVAKAHAGTTTAIDHNMYVKGNHVFQANYRSGIRILRIGDKARGELAEVAYFDTVPEDDLPQFSGTWSVYPYFESGFIVASDVYGGLFVLKPQLEAITECMDGIDNDADGRRDYPEDAACIDESSPLEGRRFDVEIEVKAKKRSRKIRLSKRGHLDVVVFGSAALDVRDVELDSLALGPDSARPESKRRRGRHRKRRDVDHDGFSDLRLRFRTRAIGLEEGANEICLSGLISGDDFASCTEVWIQPRHCRRGRHCKR